VRVTRDYEVINQDASASHFLIISMLDGIFVTINVDKRQKQSCNRVRLAYVEGLCGFLC
jgi:hypothetical protein